MFRENFRYWVRGISLVVSLWGLGIYMRGRMELNSMAILPAQGLSAHQITAATAAFPNLGLYVFCVSGILTLLTFGETGEWFDLQRKRWPWIRVTAAALWTALMLIVILVGTFGKP